MLTGNSANTARTIQMEIQTPMAGRPTNRDERYAQVMLALVRCVARYGLDGASLSQIAKEAGMTRPLVRHHLGNRDAIIGALADFVIERFDAQNRALTAALPEQAASQAMVDMLFSDQAANDPDMILAFAALTARSLEDTILRAKCRASLLSFEATLAEILRRDHPLAETAEIDRTAHGISALYMNVVSLAPLDMPAGWAAKARNLAQTLLDDLRDCR